MASEQELADMERMSNDYVPDAQGPLVGPQQSTQALIVEYAHADPIYVHKTKALPSKFSHYRTVRGDGNCGWRALAFGYFETLLRLGDASKIRAELERLKGCSRTMLDEVGYNETIYGDFADETFDMLEKLASNLPNHDGGASLLASFNTMSVWSAITYHFRLLTGAWLKINRAIYEDFLEGVDVNTYVQQIIEPSQIELDHIGLQGLASSVINAAGISIEVLYLDRSEGEEVNPHPLPVRDSEDNIVLGTPTIRLLYRPGHYDLLYKREDVTEMAIGALANPEIRHCANPIYDQFVPAIFSRGDFIGEELLDIPGFGEGGPVTTFPSRPYQCLGEVSPTQGPLSPDMNIHISLTRTALGPETTEHPPLVKNSTISPSLEKGVTEDKFRKTNVQVQYEARAAKMQLDHGFSDDTMAKREDPSHYTNDLFQPNVWHPNLKHGRESSGKASSPGKAI